MKCHWVVLSTFVSLALLWLRPTTAFAQMGPSKVSVASAIERDDVSTGRLFVGTVTERRRSEVGSAVSGRVVELLVNEGDRIEKGKPLARLLTRNMEIQIAVAKADLELRQQELLELKNGSREEERRQAESRMKAAEATMRYAKTKLARTKGLVDRNATTRDEIEENTSLSETATDTFLASKANYDLVMAGPRSETIAQAKARVLAAQEEVNRLLDLLEKHTINAPFTGYVITKHTEVGQWIESGKLVAEIVEVDPIEVHVAVHEAYVPRLTLGVSARVEVEALPQETFVGKVIAIVPKADEKSRTFPVKVALSNRQQPDGTPLLKPGMFAKVTLPVDQKSHVLLVPKDSLVLGGPQPVVYVVRVDEKMQKSIVQSVPVQLGIAADSWIEVRGDLKPGQQVVVEGNERLRHGAEVVALPVEIEPPRGVEKTPPSKRLDRQAAKDIHK